jgi:hypothetical protein
LPVELELAEARYDTLNRLAATDRIPDQGDVLAISAERPIACALTFPPLTKEPDLVGIPLRRGMSYAAGVRF